MNRKLHDFVRRMLAPIKNRVMLMVGRAVLTVIEDGGNLQTSQVSILAGEVKDDVERFQQYGFTAVPLPGCEAVCLFVGGNRDHGIIINADDRRYREKGLNPGEVAMYSFEGGKTVFKLGKKLETDGIINYKVDASAMAEIIAGVYAKIEASIVDIGKGALEAALNGVTFQTFFNAHTHTVFGVPTTPPVVPSDPTHLSTQVKLGK